MKRLLILTLALLTMLALAVPVGAAKPDKPDRPGRPGKSGPIDLTIDANLVWVNAAEDTIYYTINVDSSEEIFGAVVGLSVNGTAETLFNGDLATSASLILESSFTVADLPTNGISALVIVSVDEEAIASDSTSVDTHPVDECGFSGTDGSLTMTHAGGTCRYDFAPGYWKVIAEPDYSIAGRNPGMTMRDHVPGNWCMVGEPERVGGSKTQPERITIHADLLTANPFDFGEWFEVGVCGLGGHGICTDDDCYFPTGNPATFVLAAPAGQVTATRIGASQ